jgi:hypothetical protein
MVQPINWLTGQLNPFSTVPIIGGGGNSGGSGNLFSIQNLAVLGIAAYVAVAFIRSD